MFMGHHRPTSVEFDELWEASTIVIDTNALLNLYRYSVDARNNFLDALDSIQGRLWLPHQVAKEFYDNRLELIRDQRDIGKNLTESLDTLANQTTAKFQQYTKNAFLDIPGIRKRIDDFVAELKDSINAEHKAGMERYGISFQEDPVVNGLGSLYAGRVGKPFPSAELEEARKTAQDRIEKKIPPGYKDARKDGDRGYGDFYIWRQIIDYAKLSSTSILFITDDNKQDWWWRFEGQTLGPRTELRDEFHSQTGHMFYAYSPEQFLSILRDRGLVQVSREVVDEIKTTSENNAIKSNERHRLATRRRFMQKDLTEILSSTERTLSEIDDRISSIGQRLNHIQRGREHTRSLMQRSEMLVEYARHDYETATSVTDMSPEVLPEDIAKIRRELDVSREYLSRLEMDFSATRVEYDNLVDERAELEEKRRMIGRQLEFIRTDLDSTSLRDAPHEEG